MKEHEDTIVDERTGAVDDRVLSLIVGGSAMRYKNVDVGPDFKPTKDFIKWLKGTLYIY